MKISVADPLILRELEAGPKTSAELSKLTGVPRDTVRPHLAALVKAGDVTLLSTKPRTYALPDEPKVARDEARAIAYVTRSGVRVRAAANRVTGIVQSESAAMLLLTDDLEVYAIDPNGQRAARVCAHNPQWIVGTYLPGCEAARIALDLREAAHAVARAH